MQPRQGSPGTTRGDAMGGYRDEGGSPGEEIKKLVFTDDTEMSVTKITVISPNNPARLELMSILFSLVSGENTALAHSYPVRGSLKPHPVPAGDSHGAPSSTQEA